MINIIPQLILTSVGTWTGAYSYQSNCKMITENVIYIDKTNQSVITCEFEFEGLMQFNGGDSFAFNPNVSNTINFYGYDLDGVLSTKTLIASTSIPSSLRGFDITSNTNRIFEFSDGISLHADMYAYTIQYDDNVTQNVYLDSSWCDDYLTDDGGNSYYTCFTIDGTSQELRDAFDNIFRFRILTIRDSSNAIYDLGYQEGLKQGDRNQFDYGYQAGKSDGYDLGYNVGYDEAIETDTMATTIFNGILSIAMIPVDFFLSIFNFEILGVNLTSFVTALLSVGCLIILLKKIFGSSGGDDK